MYVNTRDLHHATMRHERHERHEPFLLVHARQNGTISPSPTLGSSTLFNYAYHHMSALKFIRKATIHNSKSNLNKMEGEESIFQGVILCSVQFG